MNKELDKYFKDNNYSTYNTKDDENSYYNPAEEIHEDAQYDYRKLIKTDEEGIPYYEKTFIDIRKTTYFDNDVRFYYIIYATHFGPFFGTGSATYEETLPHNEELTVEHIEEIRKMMKITYN